MKNVILSLVLVLGIPVFLGAQVVDSITIQREVDSLLRMSRTLADKRNFEKALEVNSIAEKLVLEKFGRESAAYGTCCHSRARILSFKGNIEDAEIWYLEALRIREKTLGKEHPLYALSLNNLALQYAKLKNYEKAESLYLEVKKIREKILGKEHSDYATTLNNLGILYMDIHSYEKAELLFLEALNIRKKTLGIEHAEYANSLYNLGNLYLAMAKYELAEPLYLETKAVREKVLGKEHPDYAWSLNNLAALYKEMGKYEKIEPLHVEVMIIREKVFGREHPMFAASMLNLGNLYLELGNFEKAEALYLEAKNIREKTIGKEHIDYAWSLNNLANLYRETGSLEKAELLFLESKGIMEKSLGTDHSKYAIVIGNLADLYSVMDKYDKAEALYLEAQKLNELNLGKEHPNYARDLSDLSSLYAEMGNYMQAEKYYKEAINIYEKTLGKDHPYYGLTLLDLATIYSLTGQYEKSEALFKDLFNINQKLIKNASLHLSVKELEIYLRKFSSSQDKNYSFVQHVQGEKSTSTAYNSTLFNKGLLLAASDQIKQLVLFDSISTEKFHVLQSCQRRLAIEYGKPISERINVPELEEKANAIEKELVRSVAGYGELVRQVSWEEVKQQLRPDEAAVELVSYRYYTPKPTDSTMYAALVLLPGDTSPHFVPLFEERQLQALLHRPDLGEEMTVKKLYSSNSELLNLLWKPLEPLLHDVKTIYYSPAGLLHRVNPAALRDVDKQPLSARHQWVRVGSTRELVTGRLANRSFAQDTSNTLLAAVWGGITYEMDSTAFAAANPLDPTAEPLQEYQRKDGKFRYMVEDGNPALSTGTRSAGEEGWSALAGSALEAEQIGALLQNAGFRTEVFTHYTASEERFKTLGQAKSSPRILHVATHGFAYPDPKKEPERNLSGQEPVYKLQDDPMLRSGLILAGANHYWAAKRPLQDREDGVLVAYEVRDLNLRNTELAVLSACQTGLGDVVGSEGVYGLQRAFRIAGAKFLIVSLWEIPDDKTRELMQLFYENWVNKRESLRDAFNHAQATLREKEPNPYNWAGFVLIE